MVSGILYLLPFPGDMAGPLIDGCGIQVPDPGRRALDAANVVIPPFEIGISPGGLEACPVTNLGNHFTNLITAQLGCVGVRVKQSNRPHWFC
jgi:hypothetical protein